jgi:hypothetical protein
MARHASNALRLDPAPDRDLAEILRRCAEGHPACLRELEEACGRQVRAILERALGDPAVATFALPAILADLRDRAPDFDPGRHAPEDWVFGVVRGRIRDLTRASEHLAGKRPESARGSPVSASRRRRRLWLLLPVGLALMVAGVAVATLRSGNEPAQPVKEPRHVVRPQAGPAPPVAVQPPVAVEPPITAAQVSRPPEPEPPRVAQPRADPAPPPAVLPPPAVQPPPAARVPDPPEPKSIDPVPAPPRPTPIPVDRPRHEAPPPAPSEAVTTQSVAEPAPAQADPAIPVRVFIHHTEGRPPDRRAAEDVAERLSGQGIAVVAIRPVPLEISMGSVRYFFASDRAAATNLASAHGRLIGGPARAVDFRHYEPKPLAGTVEIWLPTR